MKKIDEIEIIEPKLHKDSRGFFFESYNKKRFSEIVGREIDFVQDNHSYSKKSTIRGLHYQTEPFQQEKIIRVISGEVFDVAVDVRTNSKTFGEWFGIYLSSQNCKQLFIPKGFAHGFQVMSDFAEVVYKASSYYSPTHEKTILYNDSDININWPAKATDISQKDLSGLSLKDIR